MFEELDPRGPNPLWAQIAARIRVAIAVGDLRPGYTLPSARRLAKSLRVNPTMVAQAYADLATEGFFEAHQGEGTFVQEVSLSRRLLERKHRAHEKVRKMVEEGVRLGLTVHDLAEAFHEEAPNKIQYERH